MATFSPLLNVMVEYAVANIVWSSRGSTRENVGQVTNWQVRPGICDGATISPAPIVQRRFWVREIW